MSYGLAGDAPWEVWAFFGGVTLLAVSPGVIGWFLMKAAGTIGIKPNTPSFLGTYAVGLVFSVASTSIIHWAGLYDIEPLKNVLLN